jgi:hypothetical protein
MGHGETSGEDMNEEFDDLEQLDTISDDELASMLHNAASPQPDKPKVPVKKWVPSLSERQFEAFFDRTPNLLLQSQRYTGKTWAVGYAAVKHAYDFHNALVLIVARTKRQLTTGGLMSKLGAEILPDFKKNLTDFEWDGPKLTVEKDVVYRVKNRWGTWSTLQMMSIGNDNDLSRKIKGLEASLVIVDEITLYETNAIYLHLSATLGRRNYIPPEDQRFIGTCNPHGPSSWVAEMWSVLDESKRDPNFRVIKFLPADNPDPKVQSYYERLKMALRHNRTQYQRDIEGLWVDLPQGDAIFKDFFIPEIHVRGDISTGERLMPLDNLPIHVGWDPGDVNHGVVFLQEIPTREKIVWIVFDEVVYVDKSVNLEQLTLEVMRRMQYWSEVLDKPLRFVHVSDRSAFDRYRAQTGSYDFMEIERHARNHLAKYDRLKAPVKILECPKPAGSVESRTRILMDLLEKQEVFFSAQCKNVVDSVKHITPKKDNPFTPDTRSRYKHALDALTYPLFYCLTGGAVVAAPAHKPEVHLLGSSV